MRQRDLEALLLRQGQLLQLGRPGGARVVHDPPETVRGRRMNARQRKPRTLALQHVVAPRDLTLGFDLLIIPRAHLSSNQTSPIDKTKREIALPRL